ncbi:class I SAM-dependent methyltransferase [Flavisolibacter sp. BT320]|nr:class I SAM-dependent methyltransferase [Flavisolibacter longurius]
MKAPISKRLEEIVSALPLQEGIRILEIGCGTGVAARAIVARLKTVYVLGIDCSASAIGKAISGSQAEIAAGKVQYMQTAIEDFSYEGGALFDFAFAVRVGALDGRHPEIEEKALSQISKVLKKNGKLFIDGGNPLKEILLRKKD